MDRKTITQAARPIAPSERARYYTRSCGFRVCSSGRSVLPARNGVESFGFHVSCCQKMRSENTQLETRNPKRIPWDMFAGEPT